MKKEGKTFEEVCDYIARQIGYDDTVSYEDIATYVEKYWLGGIRGNRGIETKRGIT